MINWVNRYKVLKKNNLFSKDDFTIVPIRYEDRYKIMKWRNEQMYHLRQNKTLTKKNQDDYFLNIIRSQFDEEKPNQVLFSFLEKNVCIGYGGLVHMNWIDKNAELSFIMETKLEDLYFDFYWSNFIFLIKKIAFNNLGLKKIYVYSYDLREKLYKTLLNNKFKEEARLKSHYMFNENYVDVYIHSLFNEK